MTSTTGVYCINWIKRARPCHTKIAMRRPIWGVFLPKLKQDLLDASAYNIVRGAAVFINSSRSFLAGFLFLLKLELALISFFFLSPLHSQWCYAGWLQKCHVKISPPNSSIFRSHRQDSWTKQSAGSAGIYIYIYIISAWVFFCGGYFYCGGCICNVHIYICVSVWRICVLRWLALDWFHSNGWFLHVQLPRHESQIRSWSLDERTQDEYTKSTRWSKAGEWRNVKRRGLNKQRENIEIMRWRSLQRKKPESREMLGWDIMRVPR